jgi:hypothetical protein
VQRLERAERQVQGEGAAFAQAAREPDLPTQEPREFAADREAQAGAAIPAAGGAVGLLEGFEHQCLAIGGDPDPGIAHGESDHGLGLI